MKDSEYCGLETCKYPNRVFPKDFLEIPNKRAGEDEWITMKKQTNKKAKQFFGQQGTHELATF